MRRTLVALLSLALAATACSGDGEADDSTTTTVSPTSTSTTLAVTSTTSGPVPTTITTLPTVTTIAVPDVTVRPGGEDLSGLPAAAAAFGELGDAGPAIAVVDPVTARVSVVVAAEADLGEGGGDLARSADGSKLYYSRVLTACASEMVQVDATTLEHRRIGSGEVPTPSPDGRFVAYVIDPVCRRAYDLVVRDLATGDERVWESVLADDEQELVARIPSLSWSPDGTSIAFELELEDGVESRIVDVTQNGGSLGDSTLLDAPDTATWSSPVYLPDGRVAVVEVCCEPDRAERAVVAVGDEIERLWEGNDAWRILDVDGATGTLLVLVERPDRSSAVVAVRDGEAILVAEGASDAVWVEFQAGS